MRDSSKELQTLMSNNRALFYQKGKITFADGREKELGKKDFFMKGNNFSQGAGETSFPLGVAISNSITISLVNNDDRFSDYDFYSARVQLYCCCDLSESTESWLIGTYTVVEPEVYGDSITLNAVDDMHKGEIDYSTNLNFPATAQEVLIDSCRSCGVFLNTTNFANNDFVIKERPDGITHRELWGYIAMIAGGNAIIDNQNRLNIKTWQMQDIPTVDGGKFDSDTPYSSGDNADGGTFSDYASGDTLDGGTFTDKRNYHFFYKAPSIEIGTDDVVITGIQTEVDEKTYLSGAEGYVLSVSNPLIEGNPQSAVNLIGNILIGLRFRPFSMNHSAYPLVEFGDTCLVADRKGNIYQSLVTDTTFVYFGATTISCNAESPMRNSSKYNSQAAQTIIAERKRVEKKLSSVDLAIEKITKEIANSSGFYETTVEQEDKSKIYYMHNKPELSDSSIVWRVSSEVLSVSTDGGKTWNAGIDASGNAIMNVVATRGIDADWINVEDLKAFGATIGGFTIGENTLSIDKTSEYETNKLVIGDVGSLIGSEDNNMFGIGSAIRSLGGYDSHGILINYEKIQDYFINNIEIDASGRIDGSITLYGGDINLISNSDEINIIGSLVNNLKINNPSKTSGTQGYSRLTLGNGSPLNTTDNSRGELRLYGVNASPTSNTNYNNLRSTELTGNHNVYLPNAGGTLSVASSDVRLKENIDDSVKDAIELIKKIKVRQFDWKENGEHQDIGFIADELEELDEKMAVGGGWDEVLDDNDHIVKEMNVKTVDTFYMMGYVVKAMQQIIDYLGL